MNKPVYEAAVLGSPIAHSKSPDIHRAAYEYLQMPIRYDRIELTVDDVDDFMTHLDQRFGATTRLAGFSVTMPLKAALVPHMAKVSSRVQQLGVLNTVVFDEYGVPTGYNTDVDGIREALVLAGFTGHGGGSMAILGAGGTASAAVAAAADMGLDQVVLYARSVQRAEETREVAEALGLTVETALLDTFPQAAASHQAVVATLPAYAADRLVYELPEHDLPPLLDVIYDPWPTALASAWNATGARVASGLDMLFFQGVEQAKLFTRKLLGDPSSIDWHATTQHMAQALGLPWSRP